MRGPRWLKPWLVLFFLSPVIGELLSGSSPPAEFFQPFSLLILSALYGSGAVLTRELVVRWGKGWRSLLALGAAYGIVEEGLMVKSFFDPNWMDLGPLGEYGRAAGVNWIWSLDLTIYHAVFSITIPVILAQLLFPQQRKKAWVGDRGRRTLAILLASDVAFGFFLLTPYRPPAVPYLLAAGLALALVALARRLPEPTDTEDAGARAGARPLIFLASGFAATVGFFVLAWAAPNTSISAAVLFLLTLAYCAAIWRGIAWLAHGQPLPDRQRLALASGALGFFVLLAPLQDMDPTRADNTAGMGIVGLVAALFLVWLERRVRGRARQVAQAAAGPIPGSGTAGAMGSKAG
jgi:hypothetical protein